MTTSNAYYKLRLYYEWRATLPLDDPLYMPINPDRLKVFTDELVMFDRWDDELSQDDYDDYYREVYG